MASNAADGQPQQRLLDTLASFHESESFKDFEIVCGDRKWSVHRLVLGLHSPVLRRMCEGGFREAQERRIDLSAHNLEVVEHLVDYLYHLRYLEDNSLRCVAEFLLAIQTCLLADQYDIAGLLEVATQTFKRIADVWDWIMLEDDLDSFAEGIKLISTGGPLAKLMGTIIVPGLIDSNAVAVSKVVAAKVAELVAECPEFAAQYLQQTARRLMYVEGLEAPPGDEEECRCPACEHKFPKRDDQHFSCPKCGHRLSAKSWGAFML